MKWWAWLVSVLVILVVGFGGFVFWEVRSLTIEKLM